MRRGQSCQEFASADGCHVVAAESLGAPVEQSRRRSPDKKLPRSLAGQFLVWLDLGILFVHSLQGGVDEASPGEQHFPTRLAAVLDEFRRKKGPDAITELLAGRAHVLPDVLGYLVLERLSLGCVGHSTSLSLHQIITLKPTAVARLLLLP